MNANHCRVLSLGVLVVIAFGCSKADEPAPSTRGVISQWPTQPRSRFTQDRQEQWRARVIRRNEENDPEIILIGDSIMRGWAARMDIWNAHFGAYRMVNMGSDGDRTQNVLWRLENGEIDGIAPRLAVLMIGTNNSRPEENTGKEIGEGIVAICEKLQAALPEMEVLVLRIFPRGEGPSPRRETITEASRVAEEVARHDSYIHYLDINAAFLDNEKILSKDVMPDFLHLSAAGYEIWASAMEEEVHRLMDQ